MQFLFDFTTHATQKKKYVNSHSRANHFGTKKSHWIARTLGQWYEFDDFLNWISHNFNFRHATHVLQWKERFFPNLNTLKLSRCQAKNVSPFHTLPIQLAVGTHCLFAWLYSPFMVLYSITIWHCTLVRTEQPQPLVHLAWFWYMKVKNKCDFAAALHFHLHNEQIHIHIGFDCCLCLCCYYRCCCFCLFTCLFWKCPKFYLVDWSLFTLTPNVPSWTADAGNFRHCNERTSCEKLNKNSSTHLSQTVNHIWHKCHNKS